MWFRKRDRVREAAEAIIAGLRDGTLVPDPPLSKDEGVALPSESLPVVRTENPTADDVIHRARQVITGLLTPAHTSTRGERKLVFVHDLQRSPLDSAQNWWTALQPHVGDTFGTAILGQERRLEVFWGNVLSGWPESGEAAKKELARQLTAAVRDRGADGVAVGEAHDFIPYLVNDGVRREILERVVRVIRPLLQSATPFDLIAHGWGTVVAYEGLRELEDAGFASPLVRTFFTVGAALSIPILLRGLRPQNRDGRKPACVERWINVQAVGDTVGGTLTHHFRVSEEFLDIAAVGNSHSSYFVPSNVVVNRDIFARYILGV